MSRNPVDTHLGASLLQDVDGSLDLSGDGSVACVIPVKGENTNCRLIVANYF